MASSKQIQEMLRRPHAYAKFVQTGQLPQGVMPGGPLLDLLSKISPHDRLSIRGLKVGRSLGYDGSIQFQNAEQALRWIAPQGARQPVFGAFPAESRRIKHMTAPLYLDDLLACAASVPPNLIDRYPALRSSNPAHSIAASTPNPQANNEGELSEEPNQTKALRPR